MLLENIAFIIGGLILLVVGGNLLLKSAISIASQFGISKAIIGMTVVSMATSFPELIVSLNAALKGSSDIALGNVIGSNISNVGFILSVTAIFSTIYIAKSFFKFDFPILMLVSVGFIVMIADGDVSRLDGFLLLGAFVLFLYTLVRRTQKYPTEVEVSPETNSPPLPIWKTIVYLLFGGFGLWLGAEWLIDGSVAIAQYFGLSERVIGITIVAVGTSIPELAASLISIYNKEDDISLGNIVGSNIFNILLIMGTVASISPISFERPANIFCTPNPVLDAIIMTGFAFLILPLAMLPKKYTLNWAKGLVILSLFLYFIFYTIS